MLRHAKGFLLAITCAAALNGCGSTPDASDSLEARETTNTIAVECLAFQTEHDDDEVFARNVEVECGDAYHHYASTIATVDPAPGETVRVANFNVYHLGDDQGRYKNYDILADMMNQWDVVSAVELMTPNGSSTKHNNVVRKQRDAGQVSDDVHVMLPGYLRLLKSLMRKDPSWSLVMTSFPLQEPGASHSELTGFYYRKSRVRLSETALCDDLACVASVEALQDANGLTRDETPLIARRPFAAGFRAGTFDFSLVGVHLRFRAPEDTPAPFPDVDRLSSFRLLEAQIVANWIGHELSDASDKDVIFAGDFNLEFTQMASVDALTAGGQQRDEVTYEASWDLALAGFEGAEVFVTREATSLSSKGLVSNYDHLIYNPQHTSECVTEPMPYAFNFTAPDALPTYAELLTPEGIDQYAAAVMQDIETCRTFKGGGSTKRIEPCELPAKIEQLRSALAKLVQQVKDGEFAVHTPLVSDHLPVVVECELPVVDDD